MPYKDPEKKRERERFRYRNGGKEKQREYRKTESGKISSYNQCTLRYYGIGIEQYNELYIEQEGKCDICGKHQTELPRRLNVDHDASTGDIRGLLCDQCNQAIGKLYHNLELLRKAGEYLAKGPRIEAGERKKNTRKYGSNRIVSPELLNDIPGSAIQ